MRIWNVHLSSPLHQSLTIWRLFDLKRNKIFLIHYPVIYLNYKNDSCLMNYFNFEMLKRIVSYKMKKNSTYQTKKGRKLRDGRCFSHWLFTTHLMVFVFLDGTLLNQLICVCQAAAWLVLFFTYSDPLIPGILIYHFTSALVLFSIFS